MRLCNYDCHVSRRKKAVPVILLFAGLLFSSVIFDSAMAQETPAQSRRASSHIYDARKNPASAVFEDIKVLIAHNNLKDTYFIASLFDLSAAPRGEKLPPLFKTDPSVHNGFSVIYGMRYALGADGKEASALGDLRNTTTLKIYNFSPDVCVNGESIRKILGVTVAKSHEVGYSYETISLFSPPPARSVIMPPTGAIGFMFTDNSVSKGILLGGKNIHKPFSDTSCADYILFDEFPEIMPPVS